MAKDKEMSDLERLMTAAMQRSCHYVHSQIPKGWGFVILAFEFNATDQTVIHASNAEVLETLDAIEDWVKEMKAGKYHLPDPVDLDEGTLQ